MIYVDVASILVVQFLCTLININIIYLEMNLIIHNKGVENIIGMTVFIVLKIFRTYDNGYSRRW